MRRYREQYCDRICKLRPQSHIGSDQLVFDVVYMYYLNETPGASFGYRDSQSSSTTYRYTCIYEVKCTQKTVNSGLIHMIECTHVYGKNVDNFHKLSEFLSF